MFENADLHTKNWRKRCFDALSCCRIRSSKEPANIPLKHKLLLIFQQCGTVESCLLNVLSVA